MHALAQLIRQETARQRISIDELARRAGMAKGTVWNLANPERTLAQTPRRETLEKLSAGLGVSLSVVKAAAASSAGYEVDARPVGYGLDREAEGMADEDVEVIRLNIRALRRARGLS